MQIWVSLYSNKTTRPWLSDPWLENKLKNCRPISTQLGSQHDREKAVLNTTHPSPAADQIDPTRPGHLPCVRMPSDHPALYRSLHGASWLPSTRWMFSASNSGGPPPTTWMYQKQGQRLRAQAAAAADTAAERGPTVGGGFSSFRTQATTEQSSGLAKLQSSFSHGSQNEARYRKSDGRLTDTEANRPPGSHHGSPEVRLLPPFPGPGNARGRY